MYVILTAGYSHTGDLARDMKDWLICFNLSQQSFLFVFLSFFFFFFFYLLDILLLNWGICAHIFSIVQCILFWPDNSQSILDFGMYLLIPWNHNFWNIHNRMPFVVNVHSVTHSRQYLSPYSHHEKNNHLSLEIEVTSELGQTRNLIDLNHYRTQVAIPENHCLWLK